MFITMGSRARGVIVVALLLASVATGIARQTQRDNDLRTVSRENTGAEGPRHQVRSTKQSAAPAESDTV